MAKLFLDANIVIYLNTATGEERPLIDRFLKSLLKEHLFTNMLVLDETLRVSRRRCAVPYGMTINFLRRVLLPYAEIIPITEEDLDSTEDYLTKYNLKPSDAINLATMDKLGIASIVSEDAELVYESYWNSMFSTFKTVQEHGSGFPSLFHFDSIDDGPSDVFRPVNRDGCHPLLEFLIQLYRDRSHLAAYLGVYHYMYWNIC